MNISTFIENPEETYVIDAENIIELYKNPTIKTLGIIFHVIIMIFGSFLWFGIIHFERFGGDYQKRSLSNHIVSYIATSILIFKVLLIESMILARFMFGCLSFMLGEIFMISRYINVYFITLMNMANIIYKCLTLYYPNFTLLLNDDFWSFILLNASCTFTITGVLIEFMFGQYYNISFQILTCTFVEDDGRRFL